MNSDSNGAITLVMPFPPSVNTMYFQGKNHGQKFPSKKTKEFKKAIKALYGKCEFKQLVGPVCVTTCLIPPDKRARDIDNYQKALLDALTELQIVEDDKQICQLNTYKVDKLAPYNRGCALVTISNIEQEGFQELMESVHIVSAGKIKECGLSEQDMLLFIKPSKKKS